MNMDLFSERVKGYVKVNGWTYQQLADITGLTKSSINNYAQGVRRPSMKTLNKLCKAFGVERKDLLGVDAPDMKFGGMTYQCFLMIKKGTTQKKLANKLWGYGINRTPEFNHNATRNMHSMLRRLAKLGPKIIREDDGGLYICECDNDPCGCKPKDAVAPWMQDIELTAREVRV